MCNSKTNINKFSLQQIFNNADGKSSASATAGLYIVFIGGICFLMGCFERMFIDQSIDVITQSIVLVGMGLGILGYRKSIKTNIVELNDSEPNTANNPDQPLNS